MPTKILFVLHLPPPIHGSALVGQYIKDSETLNNSFDSKFINLSTSKTIEEIGQRPIVKSIRYFKILINFFFNLLIFKPDKIYLAITAKGMGFYKDFLFAFLAKLFGKKLVLHFHNKGVSLNQDKFIDNLFYRFLFNRTKVILLSENLFYDVSKYVKPHNVCYCPNGIPVVKDSYLNKSSYNEVPQLLFLSNLHESKGVYILLEALEYLNNQRLNFYCNIIGSVGDISLSQLNHKIKYLGLQDNVSYLGEKYDKDKYDIFNSSDVFIHPTTDDCFPLVLLEAMQFCLPIISTNIGGIPSIIERNETGYIINKIDPEELSQSIKELILNKGNARKMGLKGRVKFLNNYTLEVFEKRLVTILKQI